MNKPGGIYEILNLVNGKRYIGSAKSFAGRFAAHKSDLRRGIHSGQILQATWTKYGEGAFVFKPLLICAPKDLLMYEQRCLDSYRPEYNICQTAGSSLGRKRTPATQEKMRGVNLGRKHPPEFGAAIAARKLGRPLSETTKEKIRVAKLADNLSSETRAKMSAAARSRKHSPETLLKLHEANRGRKHSLETRAKLSLARKGRICPWVGDMNRRRSIGSMMEALL